MKMKFITILVVGLIAATPVLPAAEPGAAATELRAVITKIQAKLKDDKKTEADLTPEIKELDALAAKFKKDQPEEAAQIIMMQASLYAQVLRNETKGKELLAQVKKDFPDSKAAAMLKRQEEAEKVRTALTTGATFPDFSEMGTDGKPLSIANYKGKVVLIDFWATWCGPCVGELPNVIKAYEKHHANGFEIIGVSLDQDRSKLDSFTKQKKMTWPQYFDGKGWENKLAQQYGIQSIPATYLLDREGKIIGSNLRGEELETAVGAALAKK